MATKIKKTKLKEAEPMMDQNMTQAPAEPATQEDMAQAPAQPIDMPAVDTQAAPVADTPVEGELPIEVDPATVSLEVKVPTDQLAAAVSQSTGDVVPAETTPDAMATQESDLVASTSDTPEAPATGEEAPVEQQPAPVMESQETDSADKITEGFGECEASEAATKHDEDKLEKIIDTGVKNEGEGAMENGNTSDGENKLDLMKTGVDNMKEFLDFGDKSLIDVNLKTDDVAVGLGGGAPSIKESVEDDDDEDDDVEDKIKDAGSVDVLPDVPGLSEGDGIDDIDNMFDDPAEPDNDEFIGKIENFLGDKDDVEDVADALRTTASFLDQIAREDGDKPLDFGELVDNLGVDDDSSAEDKALGLDGEADVDSLDFGASEGIDFEDVDDNDSEDDSFDDEDDDDEMLESVQRGPAYTTARRQTQAPVVDKVKPLNESSIIYPVGSEPVDSSFNDDVDMVRRQERLSQSRREAIRNYRRTVLEESDRNQSKSRFNEALRSSAKSIKESVEVDEDSWESNNFMSKFGESRLNYKDLLKNHFLG